MMLRVFLEEVDCMIGNRDAGIPRTFRLRQGFVIQQMPLRMEMTVLLVHMVGMVEARIRHHSRSVAHMPFAGMIAAIAQRREPLGQRPHPGRELAILRVHPDLLRIVPGHEHTARGPAPRRIVKLRKPQPPCSQLIQIRCRDLTPIAAKIRVAQIIREDDHEIRFCWCCAQGNAAE